MKEEKKESPIGVLWGWGKPYHGKFIGSIILAVLGGSETVLRILKESIKRVKECS